MFLKFGDWVQLWNKNDKLVFYWTCNYKYTYFTEHFSVGAFVIKLCFSSKQPVINSLQSKGSQIMRKNIFEESLRMNVLQESLGLKESIFFKILYILFCYWLGNVS